MKTIAKLAVALWRSFLRARLRAELPVGAREYKEFQTPVGTCEVEEDRRIPQIETCLLKSLAGFA